MNVFKTINRNHSDEGQVLPFLAVCFVILLGFAALAIDGGMLFSDRRHAQNAADASSLAGGSGAAYFMRAHNVSYDAFICGSSGTLSTQNAAETAAITYATLNDYVIDNDISDKHGVTVSCEITDLGSYEDKHFDVITQITRDTSTSFAHLVYNGPMRNEVEAITRVYPPTPLAFGKAIANGYPVSVVAGKKEIMNVLEHDVFLSSTFFSNSLAQVAAMATIEMMERENVLGVIRKKGDEFGKAAFVRICPGELIKIDDIKHF